MNQVTIKTKVGHQVVECSAATLVDAISLASPLGELPPDCGLCGSVDLALRHREAKGYHFYAVRCRQCGAEFAMGQRKQSGELFPRGPWEAPRQNDGEPEGGRE